MHIQYSIKHLCVCGGGGIYTSYFMVLRVITNTIDPPNSTVCSDRHNTYTAHTSTTHMTSTYSTPKYITTVCYERHNTYTGTPHTTLAHPTPEYVTIGITHTHSTHNIGPPYS
jgi:hypothetical protein